MDIPIYNFPDHYRGDSTLNIQIQFSGMDLTNYIIKIDFRESPAINTDPTYFWSTEDNSIMFVDATQGIITLNSKIIDVKPTLYYYDVQLHRPDGFIQTMFKGTQTIIQDVTR